MSGWLIVFQVALLVVILFQAWLIHRLTIAVSTLSRMVSDYAIAQLRAQATKQNGSETP
jgi:hypothetical protein